MTAIPDTRSGLLRCRSRLEQWYETDFSTNRILSMEGLRGLAIALVFICHFQIVILAHLANGFHSKVFLAAAEIGGTGVDLFFLLSGMLIYRAAMKPKLHYGKFLLRRVQRIYPTFLVVLGFYFLLSTFLHVGEHYAAIGLWARITYLLQNILFLPGIFDIPPIISAAWSLSYEFSFYLLVPILVRVFVLRRWRAQARAVFWVILIFSYLGFVLLKPELFPRYQNFDGSYVRFTLFLCGMVIEEVLSTERGVQLLTPWVQRLLLFLTALAFAFLFTIELHTVSTAQHGSTQHAALRAFLVIVIYSGLALAALRPAGILTKLFSRTPLRWTGNISYSFYLIHGFTLNVVGVLVAHLAWAKQNPVAAAPLLFVLAGLGTFATATALFLLIEKPYSLRPRKDYAPVLSITHPAASPAKGQHV